MGNKKIALIFTIAFLIGGLFLVYKRTSIITESTYFCISCRTTKTVNSGEEKVIETNIFKELTNHKHDYFLITQKTNIDSFFFSENSIKDFKLHKFISAVNAGDIYIYILTSNENKLELEKAFNKHDYDLAKKLVMTNSREHKN